MADADENLRNTEAMEYVLKKVMDLLKELSFGEVRLTVHDSKVVQIERTEKVRLKENIFGRGGGI